MMFVYGRRLSAKVALYGWDRRRSMASKAQSGLGFHSSAKAENENKGGRSFAEVVYLGLQKKFERDIVVLRYENVNEGKEGKELAKVSCAEASLVSNQEDNVLTLFKSSEGGRENQDINRLCNVNGMKSCYVFEGSLMKQKAGDKARCGMEKQYTLRLGNVKNKNKCSANEGSFIGQNLEDKAKKGCDKKVKDKVMGSKFQNSNGKSKIIKGKGGIIGNEGFELLEREWLLKKRVWGVVLELLSKKGLKCNVGKLSSSQLLIQENCKGKFMVEDGCSIA
ncbi:hypothetical protein LWI28_022313 [Acer negundo]|uniref:Uncharacterized protein n=1 Tax=Acer negundo TaxID=4023 RepID=A0AAD5JMD9_ACENE|nr:hypothetical protein LWI28_022313 [Acer negundo]